MAFLPTICDECENVELLDERGARDGRLLCGVCGGTTRIVPGCSFADADRNFFRDLCQVIAEGVVQPVEAQALAVHIEKALAAGSPKVLERLTVRLPGLLPVQAAAGTNASAQRRTLTVLRSVLQAVAMKRERASPAPAH